MDSSEIPVSLERGSLISTFAFLCPLANRLDSGIAVNEKSAKWSQSLARESGRGKFQERTFRGISALCDLQWAVSASVPFNFALTVVLIFRSPKYGRKIDRKMWTAVNEKSRPYF
jgi:hypothetical protein